MDDEESKAESCWLLPGVEWWCTLYKVFDILRAYVPSLEAEGLFSAGSCGFFPAVESVVCVVQSVSHSYLTLIGGSKLVL